MVTINFTWIYISGGKKAKIFEPKDAKSFLYHAPLSFWTLLLQQREFAIWMLWHVWTHLWPLSMRATHTSSCRWHMRGRCQQLCGCQVLNYIARTSQWLLRAPWQHFRRGKLRACRCSIHPWLNKEAETTVWRGPCCWLWNWALEIGGIKVHKIWYLLFVLYSCLNQLYQVDAQW